MSLSHLLLLNVVLAAYLTGLVWVIQVVTYPALALAGQAGFARYHAAHTRGMSWVVAAPMMAELALAGWLAWAGWAPLGPATALGQLGLVVGIWAVTFFVSVPFHNQLEATGYNFIAIDGLTRTNWLRTLAWTARLAWLGALLWARLAASGAAVA